MVTRRPNTNPLNLDTHELLNILNVLPGLARKVIVALRAGSRLLPAGQGHVIDLNLGQHVGVGREALEQLTIEGVGYGDLELVKVVEDVKLGQVDGGVVVASVRVLDDDEVEPAAAALAAGCYADFVADGLEFITKLVELLGWEGSAGKC